MKILITQLPSYPWWGKGMPVYENNWAMHEGDIPTSDLVVKEYNQCREMLQRYAPVEIRPFPKELDTDGLYRHDAIFTRDAFISNQRGDIVMSNFRDNRRQPEAATMEAYLKTNGYRIHHVSQDAYTEGGEFYYSPKDDILFSGISRNNKHGVDETAKKLQIKKVCIIESKAYHLDTFFTLLLNNDGKLGAVIICMELVTNKEDVRTFLETYQIPLIEIEIIDTIGYDGKGKTSVNCLPLPGKLLSGNPFETPGVEEKIATMGIEHIVSPITQFLHSGGGMHCLTNELP